MLNRRILRIKAFKELYACAENPGKSLKEALADLDASMEATRDLYLLMLSVIPPLTAEASRRIEAARGKFNPTEEDLNPNLKFVRNSLSPLLEDDPDFRKIIEKKKISWDQYDVFLHDLYESVKTKPWYQAYMESPEVSLAEDVRLFKKMYEEEFEDSEALAAILEDLNIRWTDDLGYVLGFIIRDLDEIARTGRWRLPPLVNSDYPQYEKMIAALVSRWDSDRLYTTDVVLIALGLSEAVCFPEIPLRVTINEYVEISKFYSTPKSGSFVNGLLDRLIKQFAAEGKINKN